MQATSALRFALLVYTRPETDVREYRVVTFEAVSESELVIETDHLVMRPSREADADEAFDLLTHPDLQFVDPALAPRDVEDMRRSIASGRAGIGRNEDDLIHHEWTVRTKSDGELVALASCEVMRKGELVPIDDERGKRVEPREVRAVEPTIYVHPGHQGHGYGPEAVAAVELFAHREYGATESLPKIDPSNKRSRRKAAERGATRVLPATIYNPLETWRRPLP